MKMISQGHSFLILLTILALLSCGEGQYREVDVLVLGGGTGGTAAALAAAREGAKTIVVEPSPWLGGMLTSAGVSAIDGNHDLPAGIWGEFRDSLRNRYGGAKALSTGWISLTLFEPHIGASILANIAYQEKDLEVKLEALWSDLSKDGDSWRVSVKQGNTQEIIKAKILIDGTDLGDVAAEVGCSFDLGMDSRAESGEMMAPLESNDIIQDLTYTAILQDFAPGKAPLIAKSSQYDREIYQCACDKLCPSTDPSIHPCSTMLSYAKLPGSKYLINWPNEGNDYYVNLVPLDAESRAAELEKAKVKTLDFLYFIQNELGFENLGLADEFPTADKLPFIPYHREGRRIRGMVRLNVNQILHPFLKGHESFKSGIAVADYPIDHHHRELPEAPEIDFPPVPSFNIPMGCLVPQEVEQLLIADKAISVTNIVNGASRLQPVILQIGTAAGIMAARASSGNISTHELNIREIQQGIINQKGYLMPYYDVKPEHPYFVSIQKVGATGLLRGTGEPYQWANRTWFYPDSMVNTSALEEAVSHLSLDLKTDLEEGNLMYKHVKLLAALAMEDNLGERISQLFGMPEFQDSRSINRGEWALILDKIFRVFERDQINWDGLKKMDQL